MIKRSLKYSVSVVMVAVAILLQPLCPALSFIAQARQLPSKVAHPSAQSATHCYNFYLPQAMRGSPSSVSSSASSSASSPSTVSSPVSNTGGQAPGAVNLSSPEFVITTPEEGWSISGMTFFAVQPIDVASVVSVTFQAGGTALGTDSTPADGFRFFLNANAFPSGPLQLTAAASGPCGETTQTIMVKVVANPPTHATIGSEGGVLASEIGSIIAFPPGAVADGTIISVTEKSQAEITADNGIDWDHLGVTFLGAQEVQANSPLSRPLVVASAGFGIRVQPGQAVVNYQIVPDGDGDGIDELVVVNGATVAPNEDVLSDPIPPIRLGAVTTRSRAGRTFLPNVDAGIQGPPGTWIEILASGFNHASVTGNVAIYRSADGTEVKLPVAIRLSQQGPDAQVLTTLIPHLPPGPATLVLRNESSGATSEAIPLLVQLAAPLSRPAAELIDDALSGAIGALNQLSELASISPGVSPGALTLHYVEAAITKTVELRTLMQQISANPTPQQAQALTDIALLLENSTLIDELTRINSAQANRALGLCDNLDQVGLIVGAVGGFGAMLMGLGVLTTPLAGSGLVLVGAGAFLVSAAAGFGFATALLCWKSPPPPCPPAQRGSGAGTTGMGSIMPSGGGGCGGGGGSGGGGGGDGGGNPLAAGISADAAGRYQIKIYARSDSGSPITPFSGVTDAGGYFFIPIIPQNEPFRAVAIDRVTGAARTLDGIGPAVGQSVLLFFDFPAGDALQNLYEIAIGDTISDGVPSAGAGKLEAQGVQDIYTFSASAGQRIYYDYLGGTLNSLTQMLMVDSAGATVSARQLSTEGVITLSRGGIYTLTFNPQQQGATGTYSFKFWPVPPPQHFSIAIGDIISDGVPSVGAGNLEAQGVQDIYTFSASAGQQIYHDYLGGTLNSITQILLQDSTGATVSARQLSTEGVITLTHGGTYTLTVNPQQQAASGTYSFKLWPVPPPQHFSIAIGDTIADGVPSVGAGKLESPGDQDIYTFSASAGQRIYYDYLGGTLNSLTQMLMVDSAGATVSARQLSTEGVITLTHGGVYTLTVNPQQQGATGAYSFEIRSP